MPRQAIDWLITDTHWYHDRMVELCNRPTDFTDRIIRNLKHLLAPQDRLWHLGDVILYKYDQLKTILDSIPGSKFLIMGNHDHQSPWWYMRHGFHVAVEMMVVGDILLSHRPIETLPSGVRINVHGHWHNIMHHEKPTWYDNKYRLLAIENTNYKPVMMREFAK
jgi:calcineurin-like phosphoesterase family protein